MTTFTSLVVVLLLCVASSNAIKVVDVETICKKVTNPSFCLTLLNSKSSPSKDLVSLAEYTTIAARDYATGTIILINILVSQSGSNEVAKHYYDRCFERFTDKNGVIGAIDFILEHLKERDYFGAYDSASSIVGDVDECLKGDTPTIPPYHDTSLLPKYAADVVQVSEIIVSILSFLKQA